MQREKPSTSVLECQREALGKGVDFAQDARDDGRTERAEAEADAPGPPRDVTQLPRGLAPLARDLPSLDGDRGGIALPTNSGLAQLNGPAELDPGQVDVPPELESGLCDLNSLPKRLPRARWSSKPSTPLSLDRRTHEELATCAEAVLRKLLVTENYDSVNNFISLHEAFERTEKPLHEVSTFRKLYGSS
ncbi:hypothetical protein ACJJTC_012564 [Scirpophaga incertulas]